MNIDNQIKTNIDRPKTAHGSRSGNMFAPRVTGSRSGKRVTNMKMNMLTSTNYEKEDILNLLSQLTTCPHISTETYNKILNNLPTNQYIYVFENYTKTYKHLFTNFINILFSISFYSIYRLYTSVGPHISMCGLICKRI